MFRLVPIHMPTLLRDSEDEAEEREGEALEDLATLPYSMSEAPIEVKAVYAYAYARAFAREVAAVARSVAVSRRKVA